MKLFIRLLLTCCLVGMSNLALARIEVVPGDPGRTLGEDSDPRLIFVRSPSRQPYNIDDVVAGGPHEWSPEEAQIFRDFLDGAYSISNPDPETSMSIDEFLDSVGEGVAVELPQVSPEDLEALLQEGDIYIQNSNGTFAHPGNFSHSNIDFTAEHCAEGLPGWERATGIMSRDAAPPCRRGSQGTCREGFQYVSGTGWCRPQADLPSFEFEIDSSLCEEGEPGWVAATLMTSDAAAPCGKGSSGDCPEGYSYVRGTGFCQPSEDTSSSLCEEGEPGWVAATLMTSDAAAPCGKGSSGDCPEGYSYVRGTGFCQPSEDTSSSLCEEGKPGWVAATLMTSDATAPCGKGSSGDCPEGYSYVRGTGFCQPSQDTTCTSFGQEPQLLTMSRDFFREQGCNPRNSMKAEREPTLCLMQNIRCNKDSGIWSELDTVPNFNQPFRNVLCPVDPKTGDCPSAYECLKNSATEVSAHRDHRPRLKDVGTGVER